MKKNLLIVISLFLCAGLGIFGNNSHPFSVLDMLKMDRIFDIQLSKDGKNLVFVVRKTNLELNKGITDLWMIDSNGKSIRQLTNDKAADFNPRWDVDNESIWFLSAESGLLQIWKININSGERVQITKLPLNCRNLIISPDGSKIAFTVDVFPNLSINATKNKLDEQKKEQATGVIYNKLFIRHWDTWEDKRRSHLFVLDLKTNKLIDIMKGWDVDTPTQPFGGPEEIAFTPDSNGIVFTASNAGGKIAWSTNFDLFYAPLNLVKDPIAITKENKAWDTTPVFSPNGKYLAYLAMKRPRFEADRFRVILKSWPNGKETVLTKNWDRSPSSIAWSKDSKNIYTVAQDIGQRSIFKINIKSKDVLRLVSSGTVSSINIGNKRIFYGLDNLKSPVEIYSINKKGKDLKKITNLNRDQTTKARMGEYEQFTFKGWDDEPVYCYVVKPVDFNPTQKYPVAFLIHGGPQGSFGNHFHYRWNPQAYSGAGFAVVMVDFHGSTGYGQKFTDSITQDWGGKPLVDLKRGLKAAIERYPWMDKEQVVALGASFGGYMINWIAGNWPNRFKCLVNHDGNLDERLAYFDTEELWFPEWEHGGTPWDNPNGYEKHNPINYIKNWKTPMLVIHGAYDFRVVETQGFSTFTVLQRKGIPSKLLYFPDENHWVQKPHNSILWHQTVIEWLKKWTKKIGIKP